MRFFQIIGNFFVTGFGLAFVLFGLLVVKAVDKFYGWMGKFEDDDDLY